MRRASRAAAGVIRETGSRSYGLVSSSGRGGCPCFARGIIGCRVVRFSAASAEPKSARIVDSREAAGANSLHWSGRKLSQGCKADEDSPHSFEGVSRLVEQGRVDDAVRAVEASWEQGTPLSTKALYCLLQACCKDRNLQVGRRVHSLVVRGKLEGNVFLGNHLIRMYACLGRLVEANEVFNRLPAPNEFVWASVIAANANHGEADRAIELYFQLVDSRVKRDEHIFVAVLKACARASALAVGTIVHSHVAECGLECNLFVGSALIDMYAKCGNVEKAHEVFGALSAKDIVTWNALVCGYAEQGDGQGALQVFQEMQQAGMRPNKVTVLGILKACSTMAALDEGQRVHAYIQDNGFESEVCIGNTLVDMYSKCGSLKDARSMFDKLPSRDLVSWTAMITGYAREGDGQEAMNLFQQMHQECVRPNSVTLMSVLKACSSEAALDQGKLVHAYINKYGLQSDPFICSTLIDMYVKCGSLQDARSVFDGLSRKDPVSWTAMIAGYAGHEDGESALELFQQIMKEGIQPNKVMLLSVLKACSITGSLDEGKVVHSCISRSGLESDVVVGSTLIDMYVKCGSLSDARSVFDRLGTRNRVSYNAIIVGCAEAKRSEEAMQLFEQMEEEGIQPDKVTLVSMLKACGSVEVGQFLHARVRECGLESDLNLCNSIMDMYGRLGRVEDARNVFDKMRKRDLVSWSTLIAGYAEQGCGQEALLLFQEMVGEGMQPDKVTVLAILKACSSVASLEQGRQVHAHVVGCGLSEDVFVSNTLIDMYSRCGSLDDARRVFLRAPSKNLISWTAMIAGCAQHGQALEALQLFSSMQQEGLQPDSKVLVCVLSACRHAGLLEAGHQVFRSITLRFNMAPDVEHYACMVDLLARAGHLHDAEELVTCMPVPPNIFLWTSLLGACRTHGDVPVARRCFDAVMLLDPCNSAAHVLMASIYAAAGLADECAHIRSRMLISGSRKEAGRTWIEVKSQVHSFVVADTEHSDRKQILVMLKHVRQSIEQDTDAHLLVLARLTQGDAQP